MLEPELYEPAAPPQDTLVDRRSFLARIMAASAMGVGGTALAKASAASAAAAPVAPPLALSATPSATELVDLTVAEAATLIARRKLSVSELIDAYLRRIELYEADYYLAYNAVLADGARARAAGLDRRRTPISSLHGIPFAVKDNYYSAGVPTTANSAVFRDFVPDHDATVVARLKGWGAIVLGKAQMGPLASGRSLDYSGRITTYNAWTPGDAQTSPSGSSAGTGSAVAGREAAIGLGTQTGGSITSPSQAEGLTGFKPTHGRTSVYGVIPLSYTRDHAGPMARDILDAAIALQAMAGYDEHDPRTWGLPPVPDFIKAATPVRRGGRVVDRYGSRIGVPPGYADGSGSTASARTDLLAQLSDLGFRLVEVPDPPALPQFTATGLTTTAPESHESLRAKLRENPRLFGTRLTSYLSGVLYGGADYVVSRRATFGYMQTVLEEIFSRCDLILQTGVAFDHIGLPIVAFPIGLQVNQFGFYQPIGALLAGAPYGEERLFSAVAAYQAVTTWHRLRPPEPGTLAPAESSEPPVVLPPGARVRRPATPQEPPAGFRPVSNRQMPRVTPEESDRTFRRAMAGEVVL